MRIALLGDIAFFGKYSLSSNSEAKKQFEKIADKLHEYDYVIGNLETPLTSSARKCGHKSAYLKAAEGNIDLLKLLNISAVNLANNHIFDYGIEGLTDTIRLLDANRISYFGIDDKSFSLHHNSDFVQFYGYCCPSSNPLFLGPHIGRPHFLNKLDPLTIEKQLIQDKEKGAGTIVSVHGGQEHVNMPSWDHVLMARKLAKKGNYVYFGHHPHVIQGVERVGNSVLAYSLGNFCFDDVYSENSTTPIIKQTINNKTGMILELTYKGNWLSAWSALPLFDAGSELVFGTSVADFKLRDYSKELEKDKELYICTRKKLLLEYHGSRTRKRNINWYFKRLNINSLGMILNAARNKRIYAKSIKKYVVYGPRSWRGKK